VRIALDTNAYSAAARGDVRAVSLLRAAHQLYVPFVVLAELRGGFASGTVGRRNEAKLAEFLNSSRVAVLDEHVELRIAAQRRGARARAHGRRAADVRRRDPPRDVL
jgi:predicted nucleic acid-binding protein